MVISCTLMYIFVHWKGWLGWSISAMMALDIDLMWRDGDERRKNRQLAAVYIMYARVYLYIGEILPPVIDYMGYMRSMMATDSDIWDICEICVIYSKINKKYTEKIRFYSLNVSSLSSNTYLYLSYTVLQYSTNSTNVLLLFARLQL